jgi:hypothetical protein
VALEFQLVAGLLTAASVATESIVQLTTGQAFVVKAGDAADRH